MSRVTEIRLSIDDFRTAGLITNALQEISAAKMQDMRKQFERNALFFTGIREVYGIVRSHARSENLVEKSNEHGRDIYIGITSNRRFNGTLNRDIVRAFVDMVGKDDRSDYLMVGLTGAQYLEETLVSNAVQRTAFDDDMPSSEELQSVLTLIGKYDHVYVVYPRFINPFRQDVVMTDVTEVPMSMSSTEEARAEYIFEPEIPGMIEFFERQVRFALFERILLEAELARAASRTIKMRNVRDRADGLRNSYEGRLRRELATLADIELMGTFIGFDFWKHNTRNLL